MADQRRGKHKPKGKRDREMKEDFNAMFDLLEEHGLLMDLPEATLDRCVEPVARVELFKNQIERAAESWTVNQKFRKTLQRIEYLAQEPNGAETAMHSLAVETQNFVRDNNLWVNGEDEYCGFDMDEISELMERLIRSRYHRYQTTDEYWEPSDLRDELHEVLAIVDEHLELHNDGHPFRRSEIDALFTESLALLRLFVVRRAATVVAQKVGEGGELPLELIYMIRDFMCKDEEIQLGISPREAAADGEEKQA